MTNAHPTPTPIRLLLVDDHDVTLWGLKQLAEASMRPMTVVGTATTRDALMQHPALAQCDVIVLDLTLQQEDSLTCLPLLTGQSAARVLILTGETDARRHYEAVLRGARGVVVKSEAAATLLRAITQVHDGGTWLDAGLLQSLAERRSQESSAPASSQSNRSRDPLASLTPKERDVVQAIVHHRGSKGLVVAAALGMSEHTLRNHLSVIYSKLGVRGKLELYVFATEHGLRAAEPPLP